VFDAGMSQFDIRHILAPTDLSDSGLAALRYARVFADRFSAKLTVLYSDPVVFPLELAGEPAFPALAPRNPDETHLWRDVDRHVAGVLEGYPYDVVIVSGPPVPAILREAEERKADLIVMGTHARHGWRRAILGSVSEGVLHGSRCPVLTVSGQLRFDPASPLRVEKIVCPVNFTAVSRQAFRCATRVAEGLGAELAAVHVVERDELTDPADEGVRFHLWIAPEEPETSSYREVTLRGGAAERVLDYAEDAGADLLVVGAQHQVFRDATVIGSTTERLVRFAPCPVLVVPRQAVAAEKTRPRIRTVQMQPV
jgi:nucleotide-binding universal stress UspA family protein